MIWKPLNTMTIFYSMGTTLVAGLVATQIIEKYIWPCHLDCYGPDSELKCRLTSIWIAIIKIKHSPYVHNGNHCTGKTVFLCWIGPRVDIIYIACLMSGLELDNCVYLHVGEIIFDSSNDIPQPLGLAYITTLHETYEAVDSRENVACNVWLSDMGVAW